MTKKNHGERRATPLPSQVGIAFPTKSALDQKQRAEVVALLARLLLQVASAENESEVDDDAS
jgi:hypothetical protein